VLLQEIQMEIHNLNHNLIMELQVQQLFQAQIPKVLLVINQQLRQEHKVLQQDMET